MRKFKHKVTGNIVEQDGYNKFLYKHFDFNLSAASVETSRDWEEIFDNQPDPILKERISILSVKRNIDGEIFTIGDKVRLNFNKNEVVKTITDFKIDSNFLWIITKNNLGEESSTINNYSKKVPVFITDDNVPIYEGDTYYYFTSDFIIIKNKCNEHIPNNNNKRFSTREAAEDYADCEYTLKFSSKEKTQEYIDYNKPIYSLKDIDKAFGSDDKTNPKLLYLKNLKKQ